MTMTKEQIFEVLYWEATISDPIKRIIQRLEDEDVRESELPTLGRQLNHYVSILAKAMGVPCADIDIKDCLLNDYTISYYKHSFEKVLEIYDIYKPKWTQEQS